eukprot:225565_1
MTTKVNRFWNDISQDIGTSLTVIGFILPIAVGGYGSYRAYINFRNKHFPNIINISLNTIIQTQSNPNKYQIISRALCECKIEDIISNKNAAKLFQKHASKTTIDDHFIHIRPKIDHYTICNSIVNRIQSLCGINWFTNQTKYCYKSDIYCIAILLPKCNQNHTKSLSLWSPFYKITWQQFTGLQKIRCYVTKEQTISNMLCYLNSMNKSVHEMSNDEWMELLDVNQYKVSQLLLYRWIITKQIIMQYDKQPKFKNGTLKWGDPMPTIEMLTKPFEYDENRKDEIIERPFYNGWPSKKLKITESRNSVRTVENLKSYS